MGGVTFHHVTSCGVWRLSRKHYKEAINESREMKMQPSLEKALRHKEILGA